MRSGYERFRLLDTLLCVLLRFDFNFWVFVVIEKENLCLYGHPNESWEVNLPAEEVPPELPEPALGINFARDGMQRKDWLSLVAVHSDCWLLSVSFYFGARLNRNERYFSFSQHFDSAFSLFCVFLSHVSNFYLISMDSVLFLHETP